MSKIYDQQIENMKRLINYGVNENKHHNGSESIVEYHSLGADGKTYGIVRECNKFYIKVAPKKDTEIVSEDYDYIGGFMNRKNNEYATYALASKQFDLKMKSINEEYGRKYDNAQFKPVEASEWQINETKEMRKEINRYNEIVNNVGHILHESNDGGFTMNHTLPEAPAKNPSSEKVSGPFTQAATAEGDKDFKKSEKDYKKAGAPFNEDGTVSNEDMKCLKNPKGGDKGAYSKKAEYVPSDAVANQKPKGAKAVKMNEGKTVKLTEEQVLAWSKSKDFMDKSNGTKVGSSAPYTDELGNESNQCQADTDAIHESEAVHNTDNQNCPSPGCGEIGDKAPFDEKVNEDIVDVNDVAGMPDDDFEDDGNDVPFPEVDNDYEDADTRFEVEYNDWLDDNEEDADEIDFDDDEDYLNQGQYDFSDDERFDTLDLNSKQRRGRSVSEGTVLNDFGKHPAYRKTPMTTPPNKEVSKSGKDWNDDSAKGEQPFGNKIGSSAPYTEEMIDMLTDSIMKRLNLNKKKA